MVFSDRLEIAILFASVCIGLVAGSNLQLISAGDPLTTILVSAAAIVISYYILSYAASRLTSRRRD